MRLWKAAVIQWARQSSGRDALSSVASLVAIWTEVDRGFRAELRQSPESTRLDMRSKVLESLLSWSRLLTHSPNMLTNLRMMMQVQWACEAPGNPHEVATQTWAGKMLKGREKGRETAPWLSERRHEMPGGIWALAKVMAETPELFDALVEALEDDLAQT